MSRRCRSASCSATPDSLSRCGGTSERVGITMSVSTTVSTSLRSWRYPGPAMMLRSGSVLWKMHLGDSRLCSSMWKTAQPQNAQEVCFNVRGMTPRRCLNQTESAAAFTSGHPKWGFTAEAVLHSASMSAASIDVSGSVLSCRLCSISYDRTRGLMRGGPAASGVAEVSGRPQ